MGISLRAYVDWPKAASLMKRIHVAGAVELVAVYPAC